LEASQTDKESAVRDAIQKMTDANIARDKAENIIMEFIDVLGWNIKLDNETYEYPDFGLKNIKLEETINMNVVSSNFCNQCGVPYNTPTSKFCTKCGNKRT